MTGVEQSDGRIGIDVNVLNRCRQPCRICQHKKLRDMLQKDNRVSERQPQMQDNESTRIQLAYMCLRSPSRPKSRNQLSIFTDYTCISS